MYKFSKRSKEALMTADDRLIRLFLEVIKVIDCTIIFGHRTEEQQEDMVRRGYSRLHFPKSKHNRYPSLAADVVPYPIDWHDRERFVYFAGIVKGIAIMHKIDIRWGGDWDGDNDLKDQTWMDLPHFELEE
jgi:peptidoglycan L-alanyl-D-glutamate endopeptidase CwlK